MIFGARVMCLQSDRVSVAPPNTMYDAEPMTVEGNADSWFWRFRKSRLLSSKPVSYLCIYTHISEIKNIWRQNHKYIHGHSHRKTETNPHVWNANCVIYIYIQVHYFRQLWYITYNRLPTSPFLIYKVLLFKTQVFLWTFITWLTTYTHHQHVSPLVINKNCC